MSQTSVIPWMTPEKKGLSISGIKAPTMLLFCRERPFAMALGTKLNSAIASSTSFRFSELT